MEGEVLRKVSSTEFLGVIEDKKVIWNKEWGCLSMTRTILIRVDWLHYGRFSPKVQIDAYIKYKRNHVQK